MTNDCLSAAETLAAAAAAAVARAMAEAQSAILAQAAADAQAAAEARAAAESAADRAPKTLSVPEAGKRYFNLGLNASYRAAKRGEIPTIKINGRPRVPIAAMEAMMRNPPMMQRIPPKE